MEFDMVTADGVREWVRDCQLNVSVDGGPRERWVVNDVDAFARIAENELLRQRCDARADLLPGANGSPESMLEQAMLRDGYDDDVIDRVKENERLRRKVDSLFKEFTGYKEIDSGFTDASFILRHLACAIEGDG